MNYDALIVGLGRIGLGYDISNPSNVRVKTHARAFHIHDNFTLIGGVDSDLAAQMAFEENYNCKSYGDLKMALGELKPDVIVVATPTHRHLQDIKTIISNSNPKAILCEKPLAQDIAEGEEILALCEKHNIDIYVNYIRRADPAVLEIKAQLEAGVICKPVKGLVWYSKGFLHNGSHFFDLMSYWLGEVLSSMIIDPGRSLPFGDSEPDVRVEFCGGSVIFLAAQDDFFSHSAIEMLSPSGRLTYEKGGNSVVWRSVIDDGSNAKHRMISGTGEIIKSDLSRYQLHVAEHLANALENKHNNLCSGKEALKTLGHICAIFEARHK